jgi:hypothetical protein
MLLKIIDNFQGSMKDRSSNQSDLIRKGDDQTSYNEKNRLPIPTGFASNYLKISQSKSYEL